VFLGASSCTSTTLTSVKAITIASAFNKGIMWLMHMEQTDGVTIKQGRNGREYRLPELPWFNEVYCPRLIQFTSSLAVFGTGIHAKLSEMSAP